MPGGRAATVLAILAIAAGPASAERLGVVAIAGTDPPLPAADLAAAVVAARPDASSDVLASAAANLRAGAVPPAVLERFTRTRAISDEGWEAFQRDVDPNRARSRLARARGDAEELLPLPGGPELYADISLRLGAVLAYGNDPEAGDAFRVALALDPDRELTVREFSPDVLAAIAAARAATPPTRAVRVTATTPGRVPATLELDGVARGPAPQTVELAVGQHVAVARAPGHVARAIAFALTATGAVEVSVDLDPDPAAAAIAGGLAAGDSDARAAGAVETALRYGDVDAVVVVATAWLPDDRPALLAQRCAGVPVRCTQIAEVPYNPAAGVAAAVTASLDDLARAQAALVVPTLVADRRLARRGNGGCLTCKPWFWAAVGGTLLAGTVITLVLVDDEPTRPEITLDTGAVLPPAARE
jgi:hypothetical protein